MWKDGNTLECEAKPSWAELAWCAIVDSTPSWGKEAWLATRPNSRAVSSSKWASTEPRLICAQCGQISSVWLNGHSFYSHQLTHYAHADQGELRACTHNIIFALTSQAEPSRLGFALKYIIFPAKDVLRLVLGDFWKTSILFNIDVFKENIDIYIDVFDFLYIFSKYP